MAGPFGEGRPKDQEELLTLDETTALVDFAKEAGWFPVGSYGDELDVQMKFSRDSGLSPFSPEQVAQKLGLVEEDGEFTPGYKTELNEAGGLEVWYRGPADVRFGQCLESLACLGTQMDQELIQLSPFPEALEQWRLRHNGWAQRPKYDSLEPFLDEGLKAIRDHVMFKREGVQEFVELLEEHTSKEDPLPDILTYAQRQIEPALSTEGVAADIELLKALHDTDVIILRVITAKELEILEDPEIARAFVREVLVDSPVRDSQPIEQDTLDELLDFGDDEQRSRDQKAVWLGKVVYHMHTSSIPHGVVLRLSRRDAERNYKSAWQIIDKGTDQEVERLYQDIVASRAR